MDSALAWIGQIAEWVGQFIPRWVVLDTTMGAVKFVRGKKVVPLGAGVHFYWPLVTNISSYPVARQADDLRSQTIVTTDDKTIIVGGMIVYKVFDIEKLVAHTFCPQQTILDITLTAFHDVCCQLSWTELREQQRSGRLDTKLKAKVKKALEPYGVRVLKTMLTDLAPARVLKVVQSTSTDGN
jgi:regulator of protease activity HflC (stomatin/prohibitin superfamily)